MITRFIGSRKMTRKKGKFSDKYGPDEKPDPKIKEKILLDTHKDEIACTGAFKIIKELGIQPAEVGKTIDLMEYRLVKCQLGLFGYKPANKIIEAELPENDKIVDAIKEGIVNDRLPCKTAWDIAARFDVHKMTVSRACEAMNIKIKPCQLGAF
jgi:hypothetical protein